MKLVLVIDTSRRPFNVVLGRCQECMFDSLAVPDMPDTKDLSAIVAAAFHRSGRTPKEIQAIALSVGPGALGAVRTGASFANALAYSLGVPVHPVTSFELMGFAVAEQQRCPVLCSARAANGHAYVGVYRDGGLTSLRFGLLDELARAAIAGIGRVAVAGDHRSALCELLNSRRVIDSGVEKSAAATFLRLDDCARGEGKVFPDIVTPITEACEWPVEPAQAC